MKLLYSLAGVAMLALSACAPMAPNPATGPAAPSSSSTAPSTVPGALPDFTPAEITQLRVNAQTRGWAYQALTRTKDNALLYFALPQSLQRVGNFARFQMHVMYEKPLRVQNALLYSAVQVMQFDCVQRSSQVLALTAYFDREMKSRHSGGNAVGALSQIQLGSVYDLVIQRACSGNLTTASVPGTPSAGVTPLPNTRNSSGSGVLISPAVVLTNRHVIGECAKLEVVHAGNRYEATVRARDPKHDLAVLDAPGLSAPVYPALRDKAVTGETVMVAGYPLAGLLSSDLIVTDGIVSALAGLGNDTSLLQISAPVQPGNSGGPLLDKSGALVGLVVSKLNALRTASVTGDIAQNINFAIKPEIVRGFLDSQRLTVIGATSSSRLDTEVIAQRAKVYSLKVECKNR